MKAVILAGGYATRLFPLTKNFPKPLIEINGKPMVDYILEKIIEIGIHDIYVITNNKYFGHFSDWAQKKQHENMSLKIVNDGTLSNEDRLGGVGTIYYGIKNQNIDDDLLVIGGDNLFEFSLSKSYELFKKLNETVIIAHDVKTKDEAKKFGIISIDENNQVLEFEEKPAEPKSTLAAICLYYYPRKTLKLMDDFIDEANQISDPALRQKAKDSPGNFPARLLKKGEKVFAQIHQEKRYDVGTFESLKEAKEDYGEENVGTTPKSRGQAD